MISFFSSVWVVFAFQISSFNEIAATNCHEKALGNSVKFGNLTLTSVHVCTDGYWSLGTSEPDILTSPDQFDSLNRSTIIAPLVLSGERQYEDTMVFTQFQSNTVSGIVHPQHPEFNCDFQLYTSPNLSPKTVYLNLYKDTNYASSGQSKVYVLIIYGRRRHEYFWTVDKTRNKWTRKQ